MLRTQPGDGGLRWASFNIAGPMVDWDRWVTIVQPSSNMCLDIVGLKEVNPIFPNIQVATTLTFPKCYIYNHPHPSGAINGVAFLVCNTTDHFVLKDGSQSALLFTDAIATRWASLCRCPTSRYYGSSITTDSVLLSPNRGKMPWVRRTSAISSWAIPTTPFRATPQVGCGTVPY